MRQWLLLFLFLIICNSSIAQTPTLQQKLYYTCKVWGFVKYFHSGVSTCHVNWDSVLLSTLPLVRSAITDSEFNNALDTMLVAAGPMALSTTYFPDTLPAELTRNRNFGWINDTVFRSDVMTILDTIKNNFRPHQGCHVANDTLATLPNGLLLFPGEMPLLDTNICVNYIDRNHRQLLIFKYWNIINYFNPYNYVLDKPTDSILSNNVIAVDTASNATTLFMAIRKISSGLDDAHVGVFTYCTFINSPPVYTPGLILRYIQNKYVIIEPGVIPVGDAIVSVNGKTPVQLEDSLRNYISAGNTSVFRRLMCQYLLLGGDYGSTDNIVYSDTSGHIDSILLETSELYTTNYHYPADSLANISWTTFPCGVGYINGGFLTVAQADTACAALKNAPAIIIDLRASGEEGAYELPWNMLDGQHFFSKLTIPDVTYPGTFYWFFDTIGYASNPNPYGGTVILLFDEYSQSHTEFYCMTLQAMPHVVKIGSQTAGADGNITYCQLSRDIYSAFTNLGVYYPNGDSTQRIGIVPDSVVQPTIAGYMAGRDEVLEKALQVGCSLVTAVPKVADNKTSVNVYPNPAEDVVNITATNINEGKVLLQIQDVTGRVLMDKTLINSSRDFHSSFNIKQLAPGLYNFCLLIGEKRFYVKVVKE